LTIQLALAQYDSSIAACRAVVDPMQLLFSNQRVMRSHFASEGMRSVQRLASSRELVDTERWGVVATQSVG